MQYFRWSQFGGEEENEHILVWFLSIQLNSITEWDLMTGKYINDWDKNTTATYEEEVEYTDYPFTTGLLPVYSTRLKALMDNLGIEWIQYLPLTVKKHNLSKEIEGYFIANYLKVIDCLNRERSSYQVWTKENLLFWEKREYMLGTFRDVKKIVLDTNKINNAKIFRLWGWELAVIIREDLKREIEKAKITGCVFTPVEML